MFRYFVFHLAKIRTWSMFPSFYFDDLVLISPLPFSKIRRGDVFAFSSQGKAFYFKRVLALPGDEIQWKEGKLRLNDQTLHTESMEESQEQKSLLKFVLKGRKETLLGKTSLYLEFLPKRKTPYLVMKNSSFIFF